MATIFGGQPVTETAAVLDGSGFALPNAQVTFKVISGPDAGQSGSEQPIQTDGHRSPTWDRAGRDVVVATVASDANPFVSNQSRVMWTDDSASGWSGADIGSPSTVGSQSFSTSTGTWTINGGGTGLGGTSDSFDLLSQTLPAGTGVTARLASQTSASTGAQAGLIIRATTDPGSPFYGAVTTPGGGLEVLDRASQGSETTLLPPRAGRRPHTSGSRAPGVTFTTYTSTDGSFWQPLAGSSAVPALGPTPLVGFAVRIRHQCVDQHRDIRLHSADTEPTAGAATDPLSVAMDVWRYRGCLSTRQCPYESRRRLDSPRRRQRYQRHGRPVLLRGADVDR